MKLVSSTIMTAGVELGRVGIALMAQVTGPQRSGVCNAPGSVAFEPSYVMM